MPIGAVYRGRYRDAVHLGQQTALGAALLLALNIFPPYAPIQPRRSILPRNTGN